MEVTAARKTFKYKLQPTPAQVLVLRHTVRVCRELYNAALQERRDAYRMRGVSVNHYQQKAQLPAIRQIREDCAGIHSQVLQDVVLRLDRAFKAFFRRLLNGEKPGYPRFKGRNRYRSFTYPQWGNGASLVGNTLCSLKSGVLPCGGLVPWKARPKRSRSVKKRMGGTPVSPVRACPCNHCL